MMGALCGQRASPAISLASPVVIPACQSLTIDAMHTAPNRTLFYDFADMNVYSVQVVCRTVSRGPESVTILGKEIPTNRIEESCHADALDWSFTNVFWVGVKSGMVWKSIQHIHPRLGEVSTEILRPPQG